ncbi:MAG: hypothetical protein ACOY0T_16040 [Myxococcota bacterium]
MQFDAITRLRIAFITLGLLLLAPLGWLMHSVNIRLETQRRLRHQVVAERIFDELERELTRVLEQQSAISSGNFDSEMSSSSWEPYVVGYFKSDGARTHLLDAEKLDPTRRKRLAWALEQEGVIDKSPIDAKQLGGLGVPKPAPDAVMQAPRLDERSNVAPAKPASGSMSPAEVMRKLNRATEERNQRQEPAL